MKQTEKEKWLLARLEAAKPHWQIGDVFTEDDDQEHIIVSPNFVACIRYNHRGQATASAGYERDPGAGTPGNGAYNLTDVNRRTIDMGYRRETTSRRHYLVETKRGKFIYGAGCRSFNSLAEALEHWRERMPGADRKEKRRLVQAAYKQAAKLGWIKPTEAGVKVKARKKVKR